MSESVGEIVLLSVFLFIRYIKSEVGENMSLI